MTSTRVFLQGVWTILVIRVNGRSPATDHILALAVPDRNNVLAFLNRVASGGPPANIQKNRRLDDHIWELKSGQTRLLYFYAGPNRIALTHGFTKKQQKFPPRELARARRLRAEYLENRNLGG